MKKNLLIGCLFLLASSSRSQTSILSQYIDKALESNIALQKKTLSYEKSLAALKEAKGMFFPKLSLEARYSIARGGRAFEIPTGDLVNPIYSNLNLINNLGQSTSPDYPIIPEYQPIPNNQVNFLRETEQETMIRAAMPIFNAAILNNHRIKESLSEAEKISVDIYKRELVKEVKTAYFNYAKAFQAVKLFQNTLALVEENLRTSESLHRNHKVTIDVVFSAKAEVKEIEQQLAEAQKNEKVSKAFFNFLLNQDYSTEIEVLADYDLPKTVISVEEARNTAFQNREEFQQLNYFLSASDHNIKLSKGNALPNLNLVADYGIQGTKYSFTRDDDFAMGSIVMSWNLFDRTTRSKVQQAQIEKMEVEKQKEEAYQQISLQVVNTFYDLEASLAQIQSVEAEVEAAQKALRLIQKKYSQGQANRVEFTNARTQLTNAEQRSIIAKYDYQIKLAEFERATATYPFN